MNQVYYLQQQTWFELLYLKNLSGLNWCRLIIAVFEVFDNIRAWTCLGGRVVSGIFFKAMFTSKTKISVHELQTIWLHPFCNGSPSLNLESSCIKNLYYFQHSECNTWRQVCMTIQKQYKFVLHMRQCMSLWRLSLPEVACRGSQHPIYQLLLIKSLWVMQVVEYGLHILIYTSKENTYIL